MNYLQEMGNGIQEAWIFANDEGKTEKGAIVLARAKTRSSWEHGYQFTKALCLLNVTESKEFFQWQVRIISIGLFPSILSRIFHEIALPKNIYKLSLSIINIFFGDKIVVLCYFFYCIVLILLLTILMKEILK